jgi:hypothetical protein
MLQPHRAMTASRVPRTRLLKVPISQSREQNSIIQNMRFSLEIHPGSSPLGSLPSHASHVQVLKQIAKYDPIYSLHASHAILHLID